MPINTARGCWGYWQGLEKWRVLRCCPRKPPFALVQRAQSDIARLQTVLDSFGYYLNGVTIKIAGRDLDDPELPQILDDAPAQPSAVIAVAIEKGPLFHIGTIAFDGAVPDADRAAVRIRSGDPAAANPRKRFGIRAGTVRLLFLDPRGGGVSP